MPILFFILLIILTAQIGFWDTFGAVLSAAAMVVLFIVLVVADLRAQTVSLAAETGLLRISGSAPPLP